MLVLSRRLGEKVIIFDAAGQQIAEVHVVAVGDRVRLGFTAAAEIEIIRAELLDRPPVLKEPSPTPAILPRRIQKLQQLSDR